MRPRKTLASVTVTVYVPAINPVAIESVEPFDQLNWNGAVPEFTIAVAVPLIPSKQLTAVVVVLAARSQIIPGTVTSVATLHPFASVMVTT